SGRGERRSLRSCPTRRSSDLRAATAGEWKISFMVRDGQGPGAASLASSGRRGPRRAAAFLYLLYTRPAKLYPVFIPVSLICLACAATASGCRARRSFREKNVDLVYL